MTLRFERTLGQPRIVRLSSNKRLAHGVSSSTPHPLVGTDPVQSPSSANPLDSPVVGTPLRETSEVVGMVMQPE